MQKLVAVLVLLGPSSVDGGMPVAPTIVNAGFEADGGPFVIPSGWTPFGEGGPEGYWEGGDWKAQVGDPPPGQSVGLYQVVPMVTPGIRYRLQADAKGGGPQAPVRIGLVPRRSARLADAVWSDDHPEVAWRRLTAEAVACEDGLVAVLELRNTNPDHDLLQRGSWDNVRLEALTPDVEVQLSCPAGEPATPCRSVSPSSVFGELANLWSLAEPKPGVRAFLAGTHDPNPEGNTDYGRFEETIVEDGTTWTVLKSLQGPGAITRIWLTEFAKLRDSRIRVEVDGARVVEQSLREFFGTREPFHFPLTTRTSGGWVSYAPIPYLDSARVSLSGTIEGSFYWQINYQTHSAAEGLALPSIPSATDRSCALARAMDQWGAATMNPKPALPGTREVAGSVDLATGAVALLWSAAGAGMVDAFCIDGPFEEEDVLQGLRLQAIWDGASIPQVDAPLGLFLGVGFGRAICRGLLVGMAPPCGGYCYYPMPFGSGARLQIVNASGRAVAGLRFRVRWAPQDPAQTSPLRFHADYVRDPRAGEGRLFVPLSVEGSGHFVGLSAAISSDSGDVHFLEGDEYFWVDGEERPSWAGTGTEDYFSCGWYFFGGPITLPVAGAPYIDRQSARVSAYRLHVTDYVPFRSSLRLGIEVGDRTSSPEFADYRTVCFFYLGPVQAREEMSNRADSTGGPTP